MLRLVGTVVAILAIHFVLAHVNAMDKLNRLIGLVAFYHPHTHQALIPEHRAIC